MHPAQSHALQHAPGRTCEPVQLTLELEIGDLDKVVAFPFSHAGASHVLLCRYCTCSRSERVVEHVVQVHAALFKPYVMQLHEGALQTLK